MTAKTIGYILNIIEEEYLDIFLIFSQLLYLREAKRINLFPQK